MSMAASRLGPLNDIAFTVPLVKILRNHRCSSTITFRVKGSFESVVLQVRNSVCGIPWKVFYLGPLPIGGSLQLRTCVTFFVLNIMSLFKEAQ